MADTADWYPFPGWEHPALFDVRGHRRTASLFYEVSQDENCTPVFTMKDYTFKGLPSFYQLYMEAATEYDAAMRTVGSMTHWRKLMQCSWFMDGDPEMSFTGLHSWREDMAARDADNALRLLRSLVKDGDKSAAVFLANYAVKGSTAAKAMNNKARKAKTSTEATTASVTSLSDALQRLKG